MPDIINTWRRAIVSSSFSSLTADRSRCQQVIISTRKEFAIDDVCTASFIVNDFRERQLIVPVNQEGEDMKNKNMLVKVLSMMIVFGALISACGTPAPAETEAPAATEAPAQTEEPAATEQPAATEATGKMYEGVTIDILTFVGPQVAEPLQRRGPDFTELTGATVNIITVPNSELYRRYSPMPYLEPMRMMVTYSLPLGLWTLRQPD